MIPRFASRVRSAGRGFEMITLEVWQKRRIAPAGLAHRLAIKPRTKAQRFFMENLRERNRTGNRGESLGILALLSFQIKGESWLLPCATVRLFLDGSVDKC